MALGRKGVGRRGEGEAPVWVCGVAEWRSARHSLQLAAAHCRTYCDAWRVTMRTVALGLCRAGEQRATHTDAQRVLRVSETGRVLGRRRGALRDLPGPGHQRC